MKAGDKLHLNGLRVCELIKAARSMWARQSGKHSQDAGAFGLVLCSSVGEVGKSYLA